MSPYGHWRRRIVHWISAYKARKILPTVKYVHLLHNDKFAKPFVDFLNRNFPTAEHLILCQRTANHPFPTGPNVLEVRKFFKGINLDRPNIDKIICHSLFVGEIVDYFYFHPDLQRNKAYWLIYGGDLYEAPRDEKNDFVRRNFKGYINKIDEQYAKIKYAIAKDFLMGSDFFPTLAIKPNNVQKNSSTTRIQINNSSDDSTLEILHQLSHFSLEDIEITTILSYGDNDAKDKIIKTGKQLFGQKFSYLEDFLPPEDYVNYQAACDILILNQKRQQGYGNTLKALLLGKKVYIRSDVSTYNFLKQMGAKIYDSINIPHESWDSLIHFPAEEGLQNANVISNTYSLENTKNIWQNIFNHK